MNDPPPNAIRYSAPRLFLIGVLFVAAAPVFWLRAEMWRGSIASAYENADLYQDIYPVLHYGFGRLRAGELPLWNSKQLCGVPFQANPASGLFQPLNALFLVLPTERAMVLHAFTCLFLMGLFFAFFARSLGAKYVPALLGGVVYAFCGASASAMSRPALASALVWSPLFFWGIREHARRCRWGTAVLAGLAGAMMALSGANALVAAVLSLAIPYAVFRTLFPGTPHCPSLWRRLGKLAFLAVVMLAVSAIQWVPTVAWLFSLQRPLDALWTLYVPGQIPASVEELLAQLFVPRPGPLPRMAYISAGALVLIPAAVFHRRGRGDALFFTLAALVLFVLALGGAGRIDLPFAHGFFAFPAMLCLAVLVALGFDRLSAPRRVAEPERVWPSALVVLACAAGLFYLAGTGPRGRIVAAVLLLLPVVVLRMRWVSALCGLAFALLLFVDLAVAGVNIYQHPYENAPACYREYSKAIGTAEEQALDARAIVSSRPLDFALPANLGMLSPALYCAGGSMPRTKDQAFWWRRLEPPAESDSPKDSFGVASGADRPDLLNFMAARVLLASPDGPLAGKTWSNPGPTLREVYTEENVRLFVNEDSLPRAYWVPTWRAVEGVAAAVDALGDPTFDRTRECVIDSGSQSFEHLAGIVPGPRSLDDAPPALPAEVACTLNEVTAERVTVRVSASRPGITVLADSFDPWWKATLDGTPCPILKTNGIFRGIATPPGPHEILFEYQPLPFMAGAAVSLAALALIALSALIALARQ